MQVVSSLSKELKMKKALILAILGLSILFSNSPQTSAQENSFKIQIVDTYEETIKKAKETEKVTIVMVTESWCSPCRSLKSKISRVPNILVAKIGLKHPQVSKLTAYYKSKGLSPVSGIPDWVVIKYKDGKLVHFSRYKGDCSTSTLLSRLEKGKNLINVSSPKKAK